MNTKNFPGRVADFVLRYRWLIIFGNVLLLAAVFAGTAKRMSAFAAYTAYIHQVRDNPLSAKNAPEKPAPIFDVDYRAYFRKDNPDLVAFDKFQKTYTKDNSILALVKFKSGGVFTNANLKSLSTLTERCWTVPYVIGVQGLANFNYTTSRNDELQVENFISGLPYDKATLERKKQLAFADPLIPKFLLSKDGTMTLISLRVVAPEGFSEANLEAKAALAGIVKETAAANPDMEVELGGTVILNSAFAEAGNKDFSGVVMYMYLVIIVILAFLFRSVWGVVLPMFVLLTSVLFPILLYVGCFNYSLTPISMNVMNIMVSIALAETIHLLHAFFRAMRSGMSKREAIRDSLQRNFNAVFFTSLTTAIGFYATLWVDVPPFNDLGYFAGMGTIYAFLASVLTVPALLAVLPVKVKVRDPHAYAEQPFRLGKYDWLLNPIAKYRMPIGVVSAVVAVLAAVAVSTVRIDDNTIEYFSKNSEFRKSTEDIDRNLTGVNVYEFNFDSGKPGGISDPAFLQKIEKFKDYLLSHPEYQFTFVSSITDVVKRIHRTMNGDDPAHYAIPGSGSAPVAGSSANLIAQYLLMYNLSLPQGVDLNGQINLDNSQTRVTAFMRSQSSWKQMEAVDAINAWLAAEMPEVHARALGVPVLFGRLSKLAVPGSIMSLVTSLVFIVLCMTFVFRSVRVGLWSMIPNLVPILLVFGAVGIMGIPVNLSIAVVGEITLGIIVDDTIHYISKFLHYQREGKSAMQALRYGFSDGGDALVSTTFILVMGFSSLILSDFMPTKILGILSVAIISLGLATEFFLLPVCVLLFSKKSGKTPHRVVALDAVEA